MKWFYDLKISKKLISAFVFVAMISLVVGIIGIVNIDTIDKNDTILYENMTVPLSQMSTIATDFQRVRIATRDIIMATTSQEIREKEEQIQQVRAEIDKNATEFQKKILSEKVTLAFNEFMESRKNYSVYLNQLIDLARENKDEEAQALLNDGGMTRAVKAEQDSIQKLVNMKIDDAKNKSDYNSLKAGKAKTAMVVVICVGTLFAVGIGLFISRIISRPILQIVNGAERIADGDLNVEIEIDTKDEIGSLAHAFSKMTYNLNEVMANIRSASEQVAAGSKQVSDSSMILSQGATEQASSVEQLSVSLEQISTQTKQNANSASQANMLAENTKSDAIKGNDQMKEMLRAMEEINSSSANISKIIKVIDEIAFQTNILALNAAVEAARAGQYGKGFAVVAEEVRNLAARSANAAKETTAMIEESIKKVEGGTKIADETSRALNKIVESIASVANIVENIANASNEQASGITQINQGIAQVSQVIQANSSTSQESAAASEELAGQAELLKTQVDMFNLKTATKYLPSKTIDRMDTKTVKILEGMNDKNNRGYNNDSINGLPKKISLTDGEFGKY